MIRNLLERAADMVSSAISELQCTFYVVMKDVNFVWMRVCPMYGLNATAGVAFVSTRDGVILMVRSETSFVFIFPSSSVKAQDIHNAYQKNFPNLMYATVRNRKYFEPFIAEFWARWPDIRSELKRRSNSAR